MKKYYEEAKYNAAFDRCVDVMSQMLQKYGHQVLDKLEQDAPQEVELSLIHISEPTRRTPISYAAYFRSLSRWASKLYPSTCIEVDTLV